MRKQPNSRYCFGCGIENPIGLKLFFYEDDEGRVISHFTAGDEHQGYPGRVHGGIVATMLDEVTGRVVIAENTWAVTGRLEIRYRRPVPIGQELTIVGQITRLRSRTVEAHGEIRLADGTVCAEATGTYMRLPEEERQGLESELGFWQVVPDG